MVDDGGLGAWIGCDERDHKQRSEITTRLFFTRNGHQTSLRPCKILIPFRFELEARLIKSQSPNKIEV